MHVRELMTRSVATCRRHDSLAYAARLMWDRDCGVVPLVDDADRVVGVLTDRDICMATWSKGRAPQHIRAEEAASRVVHAIGEDDPIELAEARMRTHQVRRLPVLDASGRLLGIVSISDLARKIHSEALYPHDALGPQSLALTLAVISRSRQTQEPSAIAEPALVVAQA